MIKTLRNQAHPKCIVCNPENKNGLNLEFDLSNDGSISTVFNFDETYAGYPGMLHGGVISSILDGAMCNCLFAKGRTAVTAEMHTRFRHPIATGIPATVEVKLKEIMHPIYILEGKIIQDNKIKVTVKAKFFDRPELKKHEKKEN